MSEWVRHGECNGCGYCCTFVGRSVATFDVVPPEPVDEAYVAIRGFRVVSKDGLPMIQGNVLLYAPCPQHRSEAKQCAIYETRPRACQDFPSRPEQVVNTPCSYWFERMMGGQVEYKGGNASPYQEVQHVGA